MDRKFIQLSETIAKPLFSRCDESVLYSQLRECSTKPAGDHKQTYWRRVFTKTRFKAAVTGSVLIFCYVAGKYGISRIFIAKAYEKERDEKYKGKWLTLDQAIKKSRDLCQRIKDETGSPGLTVAVSVNGDTVWSEGMGFADVENRQPCNPETIFRIASISKSITMATVAKLWENGDLNLDKPVQFYVPSFPEKTFDGKRVTITTRDLVSHLSGIRHYYKDYSKYKKIEEPQNHSEQSSQKALSSTSKSDDSLSTTGQSDSTKQPKREEKKSSQSETINLTKTELSSQSKSKAKKGNQDEAADEMMLAEYYIKKKYSSVTESLELFKDDPLVYMPGTHFLYTTHGWTVISAVVEGAAKTSFEKCIKKLLKDLGMNSTFLEENKPLIYNRGRHYVKNKRGRLENAPYVDLSYKWAGGGLISNVLDLVRFGNIMLYSYQMPGACSHGNKQKLPNDARNNQHKSSQDPGISVGQKSKDIRENINSEVMNSKKSHKIKEIENFIIDEKLQKRDQDHVRTPTKNQEKKQNGNQSESLLAGYLKPETVKMIWEPVSKTNIDWGTGGFYGMGWGVFETKQEYGLCKQQKYYVSHTGGAIGASSVLLILPSEKEFSSKGGSSVEYSGKYPLHRVPPQGIVVAILVNMTSVGLNKTALEIAKTFEKASLSTSE